MKLDDETFIKWQRWIEKIGDDLQLLLSNQEIYNYFSDIIKSNKTHIDKNQGVIFVEFIEHCYAVYISVGIRRHIDKNSQSISLMRLLTEIKQCASQFTYEFYKTRHPIQNTHHIWQKLVFEKFSSDRLVISKQIISADIQELEDVGCKIRKLVDRFYAHLDSRLSEVSITYKETSQFLDILNNTTKKYLNLITGNGYRSVQPIIAGNWKKIFRVPLDITIPVNGKRIISKSNDTEPNS